MRQVKRHYIYGSGFHGCLYDYGPNLATSIKSAVESLDALFELDQTRLASLENDGYVKLGRDFGADYAEIIPCDCNTPEEHCEPGEHIELDDYYIACQGCDSFYCKDEDCGELDYPELDRPTA